MLCVKTNIKVKVIPEQAEVTQAVNNKMLCVKTNIKVKVIPEQTEVTQAVPGRLRP